MLGQPRLKVVIHGGMHKTGTTSIQSVLNSSKAALQAGGCLFVSEANNGLSHCLDVRLDDWRVEKARFFIDQALRLGCKTLLLSHEVVSAFSSAQFKQLTDCFYDCDLSYVFFFRHWSEFLPSRWSQYCLRRDTQTFRQYLTALQESACRHIDWNQALVLDRAIESGRCSVQAVSYNNAVMKDGSVVPGFLRLCGVASGLKLSISLTDEQLNQRAKTETVELLRLFNGVVANQQGLAQNDLFQSIYESRQCGGFFDLATTLQTLEPAVKQRWEQTIESTSTSHVFDSGQWREPEKRLLGHEKRFVNAAGSGAIHAPESYNNPSTVVASSLTWEDFLSIEPELVGGAARRLFSRTQPVV